MMKQISPFQVNRNKFVNFLTTNVEIMQCPRLYIVTQDPQLRMLVLCKHSSIQSCLCSLPCFYDFIICERHSLKHFHEALRVLCWSFPPLFITHYDVHVERILLIQTMIMGFRDVHPLIWSAEVGLIPELNFLTP